MNTGILTLLGPQLLTFLTVLFSLCLPTEVPAQDIRAVDVVPDQEKRSCIQAVDAYAYLSENMTLAQTRAAAFAEAKRQALEAGKTYIKSKTKVKDFEVEYDMVWSDAEGAVTILEQKDHGVEDNTRYHVWIKAEVEYSLKPKQQEHAQTMLLGKEAPLTVKVWTPKKWYADGENIEIYVQGNRDFYGRIVDVTPSGQIVQLLPNEYRIINFFEGGRVYKIPDTEDRFDLKVTAPYGEDQIIVYASEVPVGQVDMESAGRGLRQYKGDQKSFDTLTRSVDLTRSIEVVGDQSAAEFYEATWFVTTSIDGSTTDDSRGVRKKKQEPQEPIPMTGGAGATKPFDAAGDNAH